MTVWYNSYNNKFLSDRAHEEYFADLVSRRQTEEYFDKFLEEKDRKSTRLNSSHTS